MSYLEARGQSPCSFITGGAGSGLCISEGSRVSEKLASPLLSTAVLLISEDHEAAHKEIRAEGPGGQRER